MHYDESRVARYDRGTDKHLFSVFMRYGGWCWYQDPRAVIHDGKLFIGSVRCTGKGEALVGVYDLRAGKSVGTVTLNDHLDSDDHNCPVFYARPDRRVLAVYARHHSDEFHCSRLSDATNPLTWSGEALHVRRSANPEDRVTYMNLFHLKSEGVLYNFFRLIDFNPTFITSSDHGTTWSEPVHFFKSEVGGRHRPYPRYASNNKDTIHVSISDAHPRDFGNSIYYFAFHAGRYLRANGTVIKELGNDGPLHPSEAELIYRGSMAQSKSPGYESVPGAAWTSDTAVDHAGRPHIGYSLYLSNTDHRYRLASWNGSRWIDREIAYGGKCLYPSESSYTGLVTLDPVDPANVFISTDVDPTTGRDTGGKHEIYRARIGLNDDVGTIRWQPVTSGSTVRNLRPVVLREGNQRIVLWQRGDFVTFLNYDLDTVGFIEFAR